MEKPERKIQFFKKTHKPKTQYYIDQNGDVRKGPMRYPRCMLCNEDLQEIRKNNPRRRVIKFCSGNCEREFNRRQKIRNKLGCDSLIWNTKNGNKALPRNEMKAFYVRKDKSPLEIPYNARKSKFLKK